jgi:predicted transcriptional regulator
MKVGWCLLPSTIISFQRQLGLKATDLNIILHLVNHWWYADRLPYPSKARMAEAMGVHKSTIQRRIRKMETNGLIRRIERKEPERGQTTNYYDLTGLVTKATPLAKRELESRVQKGSKAYQNKPKLTVLSPPAKPR